MLQRQGLSNFDLYELDLAKSVIRLAGIVHLKMSAMHFRSVDYKINCK